MPAIPSKRFIVYAHRGASQYCPENTLMSFYMGVRLGANGIETDVRRTLDGTLVLFHDETLERVTGAPGALADYTYEELQQLPVRKNGLFDRIPTLEDFLHHFAWRDLTLAIELKADGIEEETAALIRRYGAEEKTVITAFEMDRLETMKRIAPTLPVGYLTKDTGDEILRRLLSFGGEEICPFGQDVTLEKVAAWHKMGLNVRPWGIKNEEIMQKVYDAGANGMTVNFPDLLIQYIEESGKSIH